MTDNLKKRGPKDATKVNVNETWEINYWSEKFNCSKTKLVEAVKAVGVSAAAVRKYLGK